MKFRATVTQRLVFAMAGLVLGCCFAATPAWCQSLQIIELQHRSAAEVIPVLQPLVEQGGALSGQDYKLFVRASAANVAQLRQALAQIDRAPRQLLVSVRRGASQDMERDALNGSAVIGSDGSRATVRATDATAQRTDNAVTSVQVLEGSSAFISTGSSVPIVTEVAAGGGRRPWVAGSTTYHDIGSGFTVTPRLSGEQVVLDISQQSQQLSGNNRDIQTQSLATQVSGLLGQWIQLGGVTEASSSNSSGILSRQYATRSDTQSVWVKVSLQ